MFKTANMGKNKCMTIKVGWAWHATIYCLFFLLVTSNWLNTQVSVTQLHIYNYISHITSHFLIAIATHEMYPFLRIISLKCIVGILKH